MIAAITAGLIIWAFIGACICGANNNMNLDDLEQIIPNKHKLKLAAFVLGPVYWIMYFIYWLKQA